MHKIKKGIKKKIKGKKGKHGDDEIFTEEELEQYKREKAEEARRLAEEGHQHHDTDEPLDETLEEPHNGEDQQESRNSPKEGEQDWKSFLATTDTVLKKTSDNLEHIKESSYFQAKKGPETDDPAPLPETVESFSQRASACTSPVPVVAAAAKNWVDLDKEGIDEDTEGQLLGESSVTKPVTPPKKKFVQLKPIEDLPEVSAEDYADVFDTTYVDQVESGDLKLIIPDSPTDEYSNEPDPFDTSAVDKVLHINEPAPEPEPQVISGTKKGEQPKKRKIQLVSLGNAVDVLTGKAPVKSKEEEANQVSLLGDFDEETSKPINKDKGEEIDVANNETAEDESLENEKCEEKKETNVIDDILFGGNDSIEDLPEIGVPDLSLINELIKKPNEEAVKKSGNEDEINIHDGDDKEKDDDEFTVDESAKKPIAVDDIISEFDVIDKVEITDETLITKQAECEILDEFDAEFASIAHESIAKAKEKEIDELGLDDDEDPFDTSYVPPEVLGNEKASSEDDPFDVKLDGEAFEAVKTKKPARPALPKSSPQKPDFLTEDPLTNDEIDPFDTSIVQKVLPIDHLETTENDADLASTLEPQARSALLTRSESFDPFDTSAADAFGVTELKVLENELLTNVENSTQLTRSDSDDFDFNPREGEEPTERVSHKNDLLSSEVEVDDSSILTPQEKNKEEEELDPFDTSFAEKIQIKTLEDELLDAPSVAAEPHRKTLQVKSKPPPRPASPASLLVSSPVNEDIAPTLQPLTFSHKKDGVVNNLEEEEVDPFDTSIADAYGQVELKALESELLATDDIAPLPVPTIDAGETNADNVEKDSLTLKVKPPRPHSPACLLAATPVDENPTLLPQAQASKTEVEDFDPFDTSIAQQFGKTELQVLESQLLSSEPVHNLDDDFDPRAVTPEPGKPPRPQRPLTPRTPPCLLSSEGDTGVPVDIPIAPSSPQKKTEDDFDPFDTSIADKFGTTELKTLENELISRPTTEYSENTVKASVIPQDLNITTEQAKPLQPPQQCLLATTPTDSSQPLQPLINSSSSKQESETEDFDPFDTSIANQFGRTEIKQLETTLLSEEHNPVSPNLYNSVIQKTISIPDDNDPFDTSIVDQHHSEEIDQDDFDPRCGEVSEKKHTLDLLDSTEVGVIENPVPILQPQESKDVASKEDEEIDPFDTSIASSIVPGKTELKLLESELLSS